MTLQELINKFGKSYKSSSYIQDLEHSFRNAIDNDFEDQFREYADKVGYGSLVEDEDYDTVTGMIEDCVVECINIEIPYEE